MKYISNLTEQILKDHAASNLKKDQSKISYKNVVESICNYCKKDLILIDTNDAESYFSYSKKVAKNDESTLAFKRSVLLSIALFMEENRKKYGLMPYDYAEVYRSLHFDSLQYVDPETIPAIKDVDRLIAYLRVKGDFRTLLAVSFAVKCALTTSEILNISFDDFIVNDENEKLLHVADPNFPKDRYIKLPIDIIKIIDLYFNSLKGIEQIRYLPGQKIFIKSNHKPIAYRILVQGLKEACLGAGVSLTFNNLRNLCITYLIKNGASEEDISQLTNSTTSFYKRYSPAVSSISKAAADYNCIYIRF